MLPKISLAALVIGLALTPDAMANTATATVNFSGTVTSSASFTTPAAPPANNAPVVIPISNGSGGYALNGTASLGITVNAPTTLTVSDPIRNGGDGATQASSLKAMLTTSAGNVYSPTYGSGTTLTVTNLNDPTVSVSFTITYPTVVLPGTYIYTATITAVGS